MSKYPIAIPFMGEEEVNAASQAVRSGWVAQGPRVAELEKEFSQYTGARFSCATTNGTTALHLALKAVGVKPGDVVLTVSHSFIASANAVRHCMAEPVFIDIAPRSYNMDVAALERVLCEDCEEHDGDIWYRNIAQLTTGESPLCFIKPPLGRVAAILAVHQIGFPCEIEATMKIARRFSLPVVEDAACAIGSEVAFGEGRALEKIGKPHSDIACFSFHPRKVVTTGEGGMLTTNNPEFDRLVRSWRSHGMILSAVTRHEDSAIRFEGCETTGYNYRMSDIQGGVGLEQMRKLENFIEKRRCLAACYSERLESIPWLESADESGVKPNWQSYPIALAEAAPVGQVGLMQYLLDKGISTRRGIMNAHQEPPYLSQKWSLPESEQARDRTVMLPFYQQLDERDIDYISECIGEI